MSFECKVCCKDYKSYQSLWNHNKRFHVKSVIQCDTSVIQNSLVCDTSVINNPLICKFCNRTFNFRNNRWKHEKICKKNNIDKEQQAKELEKKKLELEIAKENNKLAKENNKKLKEEAKILQLKIKLQKAKQVDNVTLKKLNKLLLQHRANIQNNSNNNNTNSNNNINIVNNNVFQIKQVGNENITETLSYNEKKAIIKASNSPLEKLIEIAHCGNHDQFKNVIITNIKDDYLYNYDEKSGVFILSNKTNLMRFLVNNRIEDLKKIYNELIKIKNSNNQSIISDEIKRKVNYYFDDIQNETEISRNYKIKEVIKILFNCQEKTTNDLFQILSKQEENAEDVEDSEQARMREDGVWTQTAY